MLLMTFKYLGAPAAVELDSLSYISDIDIEQVQTLQHCNEYPGSRLQLLRHLDKTRKLFSCEETPIIDINVKKLSCSVLRPQKVDIIGRDPV